MIINDIWENLARVATLINRYGNKNNKHTPPSKAKDTRVHVLPGLTELDRGGDAGTESQMKSNVLACVHVTSWCLHVCLHYCHYVCVYIYVWLRTGKDDVCVCVHDRVQTKMICVCMSAVYRYIHLYIHTFERKMNIQIPNFRVYSNSSSWWVLIRT